MRACVKTCPRKEKTAMIFGKHINRYYVKYAWLLLLGLAALMTVDYLQLTIPGLYQMTVNGINDGKVTLNGTETPFDMAFLLNTICMPMVGVTLAMALGRFVWRVTFSARPSGWKRICGTRCSTAPVI